MINTSYVYVYTHIYLDVVSLSECQSSRNTFASFLDEQDTLAKSLDGFPEIKSFNDCTDTESKEETCLKKTPSTQMLLSHARGTNNRQ